MIFFHFGPMLGKVCASESSWMSFNEELTVHFRVTCTCHHISLPVDIDLVMRSAPALLCHLVRTQAAGLLTPPPAALAARHLWPACRLHDFGDPDKFGDLKQPLEKARQHDAAETPQRQSPSPRQGRVSGHRGYDGHSWDKHEPEFPGSGRRDAVGSAARLDHAGDQRSLTIPQKLSHATPDGRVEHLAGREQTSLDEQHPTETDAKSTATRDATDATHMTSSSEGDVTTAVDWELVPDDAEDVAAEQQRQVVAQIPKLGISCHAYGRKFKRMAKNGKVGGGS